MLHFRPIIAILKNYTISCTRASVPEFTIEAEIFLQSCQVTSIATFTSESNVLLEKLKRGRVSWVLQQSDSQCENQMS